MSVGGIFEVSWGANQLILGGGGGRGSLLPKLP